MSLTSKILLPAAFSAVFFAACGDSSSTSAGGISDKSIQGVSQKGPFVTGSSVKLFELDGASIGQTGRSFTGKITSDKGEFTIPNVSLNSTYALLEATGYYRNEVTGRKSAGTITLNALTDLSNRENVNVNLLTHLEYERALKLVGDGFSVAEAKKQAETEIFAAFGIQGEFANSEDLNIFSDNEGDAALLAFSVLMQGNLTEAELTERLTKFSMDISVDGVWDDAETKTIIADWARDVDFGEVLGIIRGNINSWGLGTTPAFEKYVRNFWYTVSGLGECTGEKEGDILANSNLQSKLYQADERLVCHSGLWVVASDIEKDTYKHECLTDGSVFNGDVNTSMKYVCDDGVFRLLTSLEIELDSACSSYNREAIVLNKTKDKAYVCTENEWTYDEYYGLEKLTDGSFQLGLNSKKYVYDGGDFRLANELELRLNHGCTSYNKDSIAFNEQKDSAFVCVESVWTYDEYYGLEKLSDGSLLQGLNSKKYVYDSGDFRRANDLELRLNYSCTAYNKDSVAFNEQKDKAYVCVESEWTYDEYYGLEKLTDGSLQQGLNSEKYLYDGDIFRRVKKLELRLNRGCTSYNKDTIAFNEQKDSAFACVESDWTYDEYYGLEKLTDGSLQHGLNSKKYVYDSGAFRLANELEQQLNRGCASFNKDSFAHSEQQDSTFVCIENGWTILVGGWSWVIDLEYRFNPNIKYDFITDERDGMVYRIVTIGAQIWMAQNLNYADSTKTPSIIGKSWCPNDEVEWCKIGGRLYTWGAAVDSVVLANNTENPQKCGYDKLCNLPAKVKGLCPDGWHLPSTSEWSTLFEYVGGKNVAGNKLKSRSGWLSGGDGNDSFGFSVIPIGYKNKHDQYDVGIVGVFWTADQMDFDRELAYNAYFLDKEVNNRDVDLGIESGYFAGSAVDKGFSIRCLKD